MSILNYDDVIREKLATINEKKCLISKLIIFILGAVSSQNDVSPQPQHPGSSIA